MELILPILLLGLSTASDLRLPGCSVTAEEEETVILPVNLTLAQDSELLYPTIKWKTETGAIVHQYWASQDYNKYQIGRFEGRTSLFKEEINKGNVSLKITKVTKSDEGKYTCEVHHEDPDIDKSYKVSLCVLEKDEDPPKTPKPEQKPLTWEEIGIIIGGFLGGLIGGLVLAALISIPVFLYIKCIRNPRRNENRRYIRDVVITMDDLLSREERYLPVRRWQQRHGGF